MQSSLHVPSLGLGIGWRPELALAIARHPDVSFVEIVAENVSAGDPPAALRELHERGMKVIPHGVGLSLGSAEGFDCGRADRLEELAERFSSPLVSEHIAFVRAGGVEAGHLLPLPRTRAAIDTVVQNVRLIQGRLRSPMALENISALVEWPGDGMDEAEFVSEIVRQSGCLLLLDLSNVYANARNFGRDALAIIERLPLERLAYVHMGGGIERDGVYHDTHAHPVPAEAIELLEELCARVEPPGVMIERDDDFPPMSEMLAEIDAVRSAMMRGRRRREPQDAPRA